MNLSILSERIQQKRKVKKLTQADLADLLRISEMTIRRWETGKSSPRIEDIEQLAKVLDTSVDYLRISYIGGFQPRTMNIIAERSSMGKTALNLNIAQFGTEGNSYECDDSEQGNLREPARNRQERKGNNDKRDGIRFGSVAVRLEQSFRRESPEGLFVCGKIYQRKQKFKQKFCLTVKGVLHNARKRIQEYT